MRCALLAFLFALCAFPALAQTRIFLTSGTTWTVPSDWNSQQNTIEIIGHGGEGIEACGSATTTNGGGGGAYSELSNLALTPGSSVSVHFGVSSGGASELSDGVWLVSSATVFAESGWDGTGCVGSPGGGHGGRASVGVGSVKFSGGNGGTGAGSGLGTGGGGGAAGLNGAGNNGGGATGGTGGSADAGFGGAGGADTDPATTGGNGTEWDGTHGSGGGGGSGPLTGGAQGGLYGGGGGYGLAGTGGLIVITYTPRNRVSSGVF